MSASDLSQNNKEPSHSNLVKPMLPQDGLTSQTQTKTSGCSGSVLGRPNLRTLLQREKSTNLSMEKFLSSPSVKRSAAENDNLEVLSSPFSKRIMNSQCHSSPSPQELEYSISDSPDNSPNNPFLAGNNMSSNLDASLSLETAPPLDSSNIDPQMKNFLKFMLQENRMLNERILSVQTNNSKRLDVLESAVFNSNEDRAKDMLSVNARLSSIEDSNSGAIRKVEERLRKIEMATQAKPDVDVEVVKRLEDRLEAQERARKRNSIVIKGEPMAVVDLKGQVKRFLSDKFNYAGSISNVRILSRDPKNFNKTDYIAVDLESFEDKINILRSKKSIPDLGSVFVNADLTERERKVGSKLRTFARSLRPDGSGIRYSYQKVFVDGSWYKWDSNKKMAVKCSNVKSGGSFPAHTSSQSSNTPENLT